RECRRYPNQPTLFWKRGPMKRIPPSAFCLLPSVLRRVPLQYFRSAEVGYHSTREMRWKQGRCSPALTSVLKGPALAGALALPPGITLSVGRKTRGCYHGSARPTTVILWLVQGAECGFPQSRIVLSCARSASLWPFL